MKKVIILGSTGSIGQNTLDIIRRFPKEFKVAGLACNKNIALLTKQITEFNPESVAIKNITDLESIPQKIRKTTTIHFGNDAALSLVKSTKADILISAASGISPIYPTLEAINKKMHIGIANKETIVVAGNLILKAANKNKVKIIPIDSEHSAIYQLLQNRDKDKIKRIILTASGGPFLNLPNKNFESVTKEDALNHPTWKMGEKITIDCATLMNKGLELIEACKLFGIEQEKIEILIHPQSIVHSMVEFIDGAIFAHMGPNDMRHPISYALFQEKRNKLELPYLDFDKINNLEFKKLDTKKFKSVGLARKALKEGQGKLVVLNAANDVAVRAFLDRRIKFSDIPDIVEKMILTAKRKKLNSLQEILKEDKNTRLKTNHLIDIMTK